MHDTLISNRPEPRATRLPAEQPAPSTRFTLARVEVVEAAPAPSDSLLDLINALLAKDTASHEELVALRARLRRYASQVNRLSSLLRALQRPTPAPSSTSSSLAPSTSSSCQSA